MYSNIKVIAFDADDTLWVNEPYFRDIESNFCKLISNYIKEDLATQKLLDTEIGNLHLYGYGVKGFILSLIETAIKVSDSKVSANVIHEIIDLGKNLLNKEIELLDGVTEVLDYLTRKKYRLIVATKGDLLDQQRKLDRSGLEKYFHHIEVMSDKKTSDYQKLIKHLDINANEFIMIGNSIKSDILPVTEMGGQAIHIPFHTTWVHENVELKEPVNGFITKESILELKELF